jgi:branched-chain amino acid transport system substrate-binding protein
MRSLKRQIVMVMVVFCFLTFWGKFVYGVEYTITHSGDFTGPFAVVMKTVDDCEKVFFQWWNDTKGKELGVKLFRKVFDSRYDATVVASLWPGILAGDKPIAHLGAGGPDVAALMKRLPNDKVPMFMPAPAYGFTWLPNQWVFMPRPTYVHELAGFLNWVHLNKIKGRPVRLAAVSTQTPAFVDQIDGLEAFVKVNPWVEFVGTEWVKMQPVSLISEIRRLHSKKPDFIYSGCNTSITLAIARAEQELGIQIPLILSSHNGIQMSSFAGGDIKLLEGDYESYACDPALDLSKPAPSIYTSYKEKMKLGSNWTSLSVQYCLQALLALRAVERAVAVLGPEKVTGEAVYNAMFYKPFTEEDLLGMASALTFTKDAPFSLKDVKVRITTVREGKHVLASTDWIPVPSVPNWVK